MLIFLNIIKLFFRECVIYILNDVSNPIIKQMQKMENFLLSEKVSKLFFLLFIYFIKFKLICEIYF